MSNKNWLLNAAAIKSARTCIKIVEEELGVRLTLSHPDFISLLTEYSELTDDPQLSAAVKDLMSFTGAVNSQSSNAPKKSKVISISSSAEQYRNEANRRTEHPERRDESVSFNGKDYSRWHDGKEFKGLYRGQPRYA